MPDRTFALMAPLAQLHASKMTPAVEAILDRVAMDAAVAAALVARGMNPGLAHLTVQQWRGMGLQVGPEVYAPAHLLEATLTGVATPAARTLAATQPWLVRSLMQAPGYEMQMGMAPLGMAPRMEGMVPWMAPGRAARMTPWGSHHTWMD